MVLKPWGERKRTVFQIMPEVQGQLSQIPGIPGLRHTAAALPGGSQFSD